MTITTHPKKLTFQQYLDYHDGSDIRYELVKGELLLMNPPSIIHFRIAKFLERLFDQEIQKQGKNWEAFQGMGQRTDENTSRLPDVLVAPVEQLEPLTRSAVLETPAPLAVEIVSPSTAKDDYQDKLQEYQALGIAEYWIADPRPSRQCVIICALQNGVYQQVEYRNDEVISSPTFPELALTARQILEVGKG